MQDIVVPFLGGLGQEMTAGLVIYLGSRIVHLPAFVQRNWPDTWPGSGRIRDGPMEIEDLIARLKKRPIGKYPMRVTVKGTLFPSVLLTSGWWERQPKTVQDLVDWKSPLQKWFFTGFEQWGPSWDINPEVVDAGNPLFGQLASGDEVNSVAVAITGEEAARVRKELLGEQRLLPAEVTGHLCHRSHLPQEIARHAQRWGEMFDYCLVVDSSGSDKFKPVQQTRDMVDSYSGYLWQCVAPKGMAKQGNMGNWNVSIADVYFVWEHAEFSKPEALEFFQESLQRKVEQVVKKIGPVDLLQRSSPLALGETNPLIPTSDFYRTILSKSLTNA